MTFKTKILQKNTIYNKPIIKLKNKPDLELIVGQTINDYSLLLNIKEFGLFTTPL